MLFPILDAEALVQQGDKTRLDGSRSYGVGEAITLMEIRPEPTADWYDVTATQYLDWQYTLTDENTTPRETFTADIRLNHVLLPVETSTDGSKDIEVISAAEDNLFSTDDDLRRHEQDLAKFIPLGRASFKDVHRRAQALILAWLNKEAYIDDVGDKLTVARFKSLDDVREWSAFMVLQLIMESNSNAIDDIFAEKAKRYAGKVTFYRDRALLRIDTNKDGVVSQGEGIDIRSCRVVRR